LNNNYQENYEKGLEYQDFIVEILAEKYGLIIPNYSSKKYQYDVGENKQGIEIKFDDRLKETGNLYIEIAESRGCLIER